MGRRENIFELLKDYDETYNRPLPISYDLLKLSDDHRRFDALIRRYWDTLHPLSRDIFTSFANEIQYLLHTLTENEEKLALNDLEIQTLKNNIEEKLNEFETDFENRINQGIAAVSNKNFDNIDRENRKLKKNLAEINLQIKNKDELIENLRKELALIIDDSDEQEEAAKMLEANISESINQYQNFTNQLDVFEDVMNTLQNANVAAERQIDDLADELNIKSELINELKSTYQKGLDLSANRYQELKEKIKKISPQITQIHETSKNLHTQNKKLLLENSQLKEASNKIAESNNLRESFESQINYLQDKNSNLIEEIDHLTAKIEIMNLKQSQQDDILSGYKSMVFENKNSSSNIPVPKKHEYTLKPQQINQPQIMKADDLKMQKAAHRQTIPTINDDPRIKSKKSLMDEIKEDPPKESEEEVQQVIKEVLMRKSTPNDIVTDLDDTDAKKEVKTKNVKKTNSKEKLFS